MGSASLDPDENADVRALRHRLTAGMFDGIGDCIPVRDAAAGLMLAIRAVLERTAGEPGQGRRYALMPAFTVAAAAQAALWNGLTPLFCDIDPRTWLSDAAAEEALLRRHGGEIAVVVPHATFGADLDLRRYELLSARHAVPVVVDATASFGSQDAAGRKFGRGTTLPVVFSVPAIAPFATGEAGMVYTADPVLAAAIGGLANPGMAPERTTIMYGVDGTLSESAARLALWRLDGFEPVADRVHGLGERYRALLPECLSQHQTGTRWVGAFMPVLLPSGRAAERAAVRAGFAARGIGTGVHFFPHLADHPCFRARVPAADLPVTDDVAGRMLSLPLWDGMTPEMVAEVCGAFTELCLRGNASDRAPPPPRSAAATIRTELRPATFRASCGISGPGNAVGLVVIGAGPAGMAPLLAAARNGLLPELLSQGVVIVERDPVIGAGRLGQYAVSSDSAAETFLSCVENHPIPELAILARHPAARAIAAYGRDAVPLAMVGTFLALVARALAGLVEASPRGRVVCGQEAVRIQRVPGGAWCVQLRCTGTGEEREILTRQVLVATGGRQSRAGLRGAVVGNVPLSEVPVSRLLRSDDLLRLGGGERAARRLAGIRDPRVVVLGGSTSAVSAVRILLDAAGERLGAGSVTLAHRGRLKLFFGSADEARASGYHAFGDDDLCPLSGFVFRFGGLRYAARATVADALGVRGFAPEPRLRLRRIGGGDDVRDLLAEADLVVPALGYRPRGLEVVDEGGEAVPLLCGRDGAAMVGADCAVLDAAGAAIPNLYGIGLAAGYRPPPTMGGEPSFDGQVNGLWLWQNDVGLALARQLLASAGSPSGSTRKIA